MTSPSDQISINTKPLPTAAPPPTHHNGQAALVGGAPPAATPDFSSAPPELSALAVYLGLVFGLMVGLLFLTGWLGVKNPNPIKLSAYESGVTPSGSAWFSYPAPFYLVALFFLIFDVEAAYIFSWAISFTQLGWLGWARMSFFIGVLGASLIYLWRKGGLEWTTGRP